MPENEDSLRLELEELRERLREAEETVAAIREGAVDALVVGDQVYTLKGADRTYQALVETMSEGAAVLSADGTVLYCDRRLAEMLGLPLEKVIGSPLWQHVAGEDVRSLAKLPCYPKGSRELIFKRDNGEMPVLVSMSQLSLGESSCACVVVITDLTEHKKREEAELARRVAEDKGRAEQARADWLAIILDQMPTGVIIISADEHVISANRAADEIWGTPVPSLRLADYGRSWHCLGQEGTPLPVRDLAPLQALRGEVVVGREETLVRPDSKRVPIICSATPLVEDGAVTAAVAVFWDISAQKEAQGKLEEAGRLKDEFLSMASHELKTPVTSIKIFSELAARRPEKVTPEFLERVLHQANQLAQLINDLLDVSRLNTGQMPVKTSLLTWPRWQASYVSGSAPSWRNGRFPAPSVRKRSWSKATRGGSSKSSPTSWTTPPSTALKAALSGCE